MSRRSRPVIWHKRDNGYWYYRLRGEKTYHSTGEKTKAKAEDYVMMEREENMVQVDIPELKQLVEQIAIMSGKIDQLEQYLQPQREWWDLKAVCARKGVSYSSVSSKRSLQPKNGYEDAMVSGRRMWRWSTVEEWIEQTDEVLDGDSTVSV